tara:strand:- start:382 stop:567 length:186 start_codon:yes stop_codon:yes gene_type:complete
MRQFLGKYPGKTIHRIGIALGSFWMTLNIINFTWQNSINKDSNDLKDNQTQGINIKRRVDI